jgi:hypothetical protein
MRGVIFVMLSTFFAVPALGDDKGKSTEKKDEFASPRTGRPGELSMEEEDRLDRLIDRFIEHDTGRRRDPQALKEFLELGPEAIPALIRGLNKAAKMSHSCPATMIAKKLKQLLNRSEDEETLRFARENIGAGVGRTPYEPLLRELRVATMFRQRQLNDAAGNSARQQQQGSPGSKGPGSKE